MNCEEAQELLAALSLGALDKEEEGPLMAHLKECKACLKVLQENGRVMEQLPLAVESAFPSPDLRGRLLAQVEALEKMASSKVGKAMPPGGGWVNVWYWLRHWSPAFGVLTLLMTGTVLGWAIYLQLQMNTLTQNEDSLLTEISEQRMILNIATSEALTVIDLAGTEMAPEAYGKLLVDADNNNAVLVTSKLKPLKQDRVYQLWLIKGRQPSRPQDKIRINGGTFTVDELGQGELIIQAPDPVITYGDMGITVEPVGGSISPTGTKVLEMAP
ncbi:MAG: anti-sigma factor [Dehalococcoidia bacterium]